MRARAICAVCGMSVCVSDDNMFAPAGSAAGAPVPHYQKGAKKTWCAGSSVPSRPSVVAWVDLEAAKVRASFAASRDASEARECVRRLAGLERIISGKPSGGSR